VTGIMDRRAKSRVSADPMMFEQNREPRQDAERIVAVGLLTQTDLDVLGQGFRRAFRIDDDPCFDDLLAAIDAAEERRLGRHD
jgi:hypothetical protein